MNTFAVLLLCVQACLVQNVYSQCLGAYGPAYGPGLGWDAGLAGPYGYGIERGLAGPAFGWDAGLAGPYGYGIERGLAGPAFGWDGLIGPAAIGAAYGGSGVGDVAVAGAMDVAGLTAVAGQVPILGAVEFGGVVPAAGAVTIAGSCGCGCDRGYFY